MSKTRIRCGRFQFRSITNCSAVRLILSEIDQIIAIDYRKRLEKHSILFSRARARDTELKLEEEKRRTERKATHVLRELWIHCTAHNMYNQTKHDPTRTDFYFIILSFNTEIDWRVSLVRTSTIASIYGFFDAFFFTSSSLNSLLFVFFCLIFADFVSWSAWNATRETE